MLTAHSVPGDSCVYIDYGSEVLANCNGNPEVLTCTTEKLLNTGVQLTLRVVPGGKHREASWEK